MKEDALARKIEPAKQKSKKEQAKEAAEKLAAKRDLYNEKVRSIKEKTAVPPEIKSRYEQEIDMLIQEIPRQLKGYSGERYYMEEIRDDFDKALVKYGFDFSQSENPFNYIVSRIGYISTEAFHEKVKFKNKSGYDAIMMILDDYKNHNIALKKVEKKLSVHAKEFLDYLYTTNRDLIQPNIIDPNDALVDEIKEQLKSGELKKQFKDLLNNDAKLKRQLISWVKTQIHREKMAQGDEFDQNRRKNWTAEIKRQIPLMSEKDQKLLNEYFEFDEEEEPSTRWQKIKNWFTSK